MGLFAHRMANLSSENAFAVGKDIQKVEQSGRTVIKLNLGEPDFDTAANINRIAYKQIKAGNSHYCDPRGLLPLRESISRVISETRQVNINPNQIVIACGGKPPIGYSLLSYVDPGNEVIYPSPGFPIYESWVSFVGAIPRPLLLREEKGFSFDASDLEPLVNRNTKLVIINSPSNPTGGVLSKSDFAEIAELLKRKANPDFRVLSDEVYEEILFDGVKHSSIISQPGMTEHTIILNSIRRLSP